MITTIFVTMVVVKIALVVIPVYFHGIELGMAKLFIQSPSSSHSHLAIITHTVGKGFQGLGHNFEAQ